MTRSSTALDLGLLDERKMVIHAIWIDREDVGLLAASGCTVAHNPISALKIGSGVVPFRVLRDAGIPICLGSDEASVDDTVNMWGVAKATGLVHTIADPEYRDWRGRTRSSTASCAAAPALCASPIGWARSHQVTRPISFFSTSTPLVFPPLNDLKRQLVFCESGTSVALTMVQGRIVAEGRRILTVDQPALRAEIRALMPERRTVLELTRADAEKLRRVPPLRRVQPRCGITQSFTVN